MRDVHAARLAELDRLLESDEFDDPLHRLAVEFAAGWHAWARDWCEAAPDKLGASPALLA